MYDVVVVGGGPSGATAAEDLVRSGHSVALLDREGRIKPCGGAIPPRLMQDFHIGEEQLLPKVTTARMISPTGRHVDIPIENGYVAMVDRKGFAPFLRARAAEAGAQYFTGTFVRIERPEGTPVVIYRDKTTQEYKELPCKLVIGADGAKSRVGLAEVKDADKVPLVFAYHEIIKWVPMGTVPVSGGARNWLRATSRRRRRPCAWPAGWTSARPCARRARPFR